MNEKLFRRKKIENPLKITDFTKNSSNRIKLLSNCINHSSVSLKPRTLVKIMRFSKFLWLNDLFFNPKTHFAYELGRQVAPFTRKKLILARKFKFSKFFPLISTNQWSRRIFCEFKKVRVFMKKLRKLKSKLLLSKKKSLSFENF